jgi:2-oxoisovalerate dehydrogenase E2 component (dihydrolipoyl transacylase)
VRGMLKELNVTIEDVKGSGKDGRVLKEDIQRFVNERTLAAAGASKQSTTPTSQVIPSHGTQQETVVNLKPIQAQMFKTMTKSLSIPHFLYGDDLDFSALSALRKRINAHATPDLKLSFLPFVVKAVSIALHEFPLLNARVEAGSDGAAPKLVLREKHNIGVAMDTPQGLLVPNVKNVGTLSVSEIAKELKRLQALAKIGKLGAADLTGGTITVSNIGSIGGTYVSPIIVSSEVAILGMGKVRDVPAFDDHSNVIKKSMVQFSWSADHRVVDGATMARMGERVRSLLEEPGMMIAALR